MLGIDKEIAKQNNLTEAQWKAKTPIEQRKMRDKYRNEKTSANDPSGQKTLHDEAQKRSSENAMDNLVKKGKMTEGDKNKKLQTPQKPLSHWNDLTKEQVGKVEKEPLAEVKKPDEAPPLEEKAVEPEEIKTEIEQIGINPNEPKEEGGDKALDYLVERGYINMNPKTGRYEMVPFDKAKGDSKWRTIGTILSCIAAFLTDGAFPPLNFYNIRSADNAKEKEEWDKMLDTIQDYYNLEATTELASGYSSEGGDVKAKEAQKVLSPATERQADLQRDTILLNFDNAKQMATLQNSLSAELMKLSNELGKGMQKFNADLAAQQYVKELKAMKQSGISRDEMALWMLAKSGVTDTQANLDRARQVVDVVMTPVNAVVGAVKP